MNLTFIAPQYLLLLAFIPIILWLFWRSTTHLMPFRRGLVLILRVLMIALVVLQSQRSQRGKSDRTGQRDVRPRCLRQRRRGGT